MENYSILGLSDDAIIKLENGKMFRLRELKVRKIGDIPLDGHKNDGSICNGFVITYANAQKNSQFGISYLVKNIKKMKNK